MSALHVVLFYGVIELEDTVETISNSDSSYKSVERLHTPFSITSMAAISCQPCKEESCSLVVSLLPIVHVLELESSLLCWLAFYRLAMSLSKGRLAEVESLPLLVFEPLPTRQTLRSARASSH